MTQAPAVLLRTPESSFLPKDMLSASTGLAVRTSPRGWRRTERLLERAGECGLGVVADNLGHLCEGRAGVAEFLSSNLHPPTGEVVHRRYADQTNEALGQRRTR